MKRIKITATLPEDVLKECDEYVETNGMTRSGLLSLAVHQYVQAQKMMPSINNSFALIGSLSKRAATKGGVDEEDYKKELAELEKMQASLFKQTRKKK